MNFYSPRSAAPVWRAFCQVVVLGVVLAGTVACVSTTPAATPKAELVTDSDEPESRKRARVRLELASGYFEQGKHQVALDEIKQALATDPVYADAFNLRGLVYTAVNELQLAEDSFKRSLSISPRDGGTLHNLGWLYCQQRRYSESYPLFKQALAAVGYLDSAKTYMTLGICEARNGDKPLAERSLARSYELDAGNPITGYNLSSLLFERGEFEKAQFYLRRLNNGESANEETLWLGIRTEYKLNDEAAVSQLGGQLRKRFPSSRQAQLFDRRAFNE